MQIVLSLSEEVLHKTPLKRLGLLSITPQYEDVVSLEGVAPTQNPAVPIIAIPTTAGTAAEVTINYVITDNNLCRKFVCVDPIVFRLLPLLIHQ